MINLRGVKSPEVFLLEGINMEKCFAADSAKVCRVIRACRCDGTACAFYRTKEEARESREHSKELLRCLPSDRQMDIADKYYSGRCEW